MLKRTKTYTLYHFTNNGRVEGANPNMIGVCTGLHGDCTGLTGNCTGLRGDLGSITTRPANLEDFIEE